MKSLFLLFAILGLTAPCALAQGLSIASATATDAQNTEKVRLAIQTATDALNAALRRGDAAGALKWMAPDFELGLRQYHVRDLAWMKRALPLQLKRGHYTDLSVKVNSIEWDNGIARTSERINADEVLNPGVVETSSVRPFGTKGGGNSEWRLTAGGWRLRRDNGTLFVLLRLAVPDAPVRIQSKVVDPDSVVAAVGLPLQEPRVVVERGRDNFQSSLAFSPDGDTLAFDYDDEVLRFASTQTGAIQRETRSQDMLREMFFTLDGKLWTADISGTQRRWNARTGVVEKEWQVAEKYKFHRASVSPDGTSLAASQNGEVRLWNTLQSQPKATFKIGYDIASDIAFSPDAALLALSTRDAVEVRSARDGALLSSFKDEHWGGFLADGKTMATWKWGFFSSFERPRENDRNVLRVRSVATGDIEREVLIPAPRSQAQEKLSQAMEANGTVRVSGFFTLPCPVISPDGSVAASVEFDGSIGVWNTRTGTIFRMLRGFSSAQNPNPPQLVFSNDGRQLAVSTRAGEIGVWDVTPPRG